ncbi:MAG TPA: SRPBCC family protein [Thermoplasmata archaeon]|nr:SRPBCC family protein [Thermoplasmata archaeon]
MVRAKTGTIRQTVWLPAPPQEVYRALMTSRGHAAFTGAPARISPRVGGSFTAWGGYIHGRNLELIPGKKIVQSWRPSAESWPSDYFSKVTFAFSPRRGGTTVRFTHAGVLREHVGHLGSGWKESYWDPLRKFFRSQRKK